MRQAWRILDRVSSSSSTTRRWTTISKSCPDLEKERRADIVVGLRTKRWQRVLNCHRINGGRRLVVAATTCRLPVRVQIFSTFVRRRASQLETRQPAVVTTNLLRLRVFRPKCRKRTLSSRLRDFVNRKLLSESSETPPSTTQTWIGRLKIHSENKSQSLPLEYNNGQPHWTRFTWVKKAAKLKQP